VLYQNDAFGEDLLNGFKDATKGSDIRVVAEESYEVTDPTVSSQMSKLASSDADTFLDITTPKFGAQAIVAADKLGWKVLHIINNVSASKLLVLEPAGLDKSQGLISTAYFKDPASPDWSDDAAMKEFKAALAKYEPRANPEDPNCVFGWGAAATRDWRCSHSCSSVSCSPGSSTTQATGRSPQRSSGRAITAASRTAGWAMIAFSSSTDEIHSPPDLITSFARSEMRM
jgi:hypothetical protein